MLAPFAVRRPALPVRHQAPHRHDPFPWSDRIFRRQA
jgi:hypothetical protein